MSETFKVGELAVIVTSDVPSWPVGREVEILSPLRVCGCSRSCHLQVHLIGYEPDGRQVFAPPHVLRKKRPPDHPDNVTTWDDCPWWPEKIVTEQSA